MSEPRELPPVLSYEPSPARTGRRKWFLGGAVATVVVFAMVCVLIVQVAPRTRVVPAAAMGPRYVPIGSGGVEISVHGASGIADAIDVPYGRSFLIRDGSTIVAIRIQAGQAEPIHYEWQCRNDGRLRFGAPGVSRGTGTASEAAKSTWIVAGPIRLEWSQGGPKSGWLYWPPDRPGLQISSQVIDDPASAGHDPTAKWYSRTGPFP